jgi:hypothetical protein
MQSLDFEQFRTMMHELRSYIALREHKPAPEVQIACAK